MKLYKIVIITLVFVALPFTVSAQFQGDVFFQNPSIAVSEGKSGELEVMLFAGALPVGAAHFELSFTPGSIKVEVLPGDTELARSLFWTQNPGKVSIIGLNDSSLSKPFGTVNLARVKVTPNLPAGSRIPLSIAVRSLLDTSSQNFPRLVGFGGEVVVTAASAQLQRSAAVLSPTTSTSQDPNLVQRASKFRRAGAKVRVMDLDSNKQAVEKIVTLANPSAPSD